VRRVLIVLAGLGALAAAALDRSASSYTLDRVRVNGSDGVSGLAVELEALERT
jgi:hypothetical protein